MLDRLSLSLVSLPDSTYDTIIILSDVDATRSESQSLINRDVLAMIQKALKPGGRLRSQDGGFARTQGAERTEAILAGLMVEGSDGMIKPNYESTQSVPLRLGRKKGGGAATALTSAAGTGAVTLNVNGKRKNGPPVDTQPNGVGFVDFSDDFDAPIEEDDDELIDEDTLLDEDDLSRPIVQRKTPGLSTTSLLLTTAYSTGVSSQSRQASSCLQRLLLRSCSEVGSRRRRQARRRGCSPVLHRLRCEIKIG